MKNLSIVAFALFAMLVLNACASSQSGQDAGPKAATGVPNYTAMLKGDPNRPDDEPKDDLLTNINPFNWFKSKEEKEQDALYAKDDSKSGIDGIFPWNWGKKSGDGEARAITADEVRSNYSPERFTLGETDGQFKNRTSRTVDTNLSNFWDDLMSVMLLDRPSRSSPYPIY